jgi:hypothetical protein
MILTPLPPHMIEFVGVLGFGLYVLNYTLLTTRVISGNSLQFFAVNLTAASCVLIGLTVSFNLASALIQIFWVVMSLIGITLNMIRPPVEPF